MVKFHVELFQVTELAMITPHVSTFDTAQRRIVSLLQNDAYRYSNFSLKQISVNVASLQAWAS